jgi:hypothetical protein
MFEVLEKDAVESELFHKYLDDYMILLVKENDDDYGNRVGDLLYKTAVSGMIEDFVHNNECPDGYLFKILLGRHVFAKEYGGPADYEIKWK